MRERSATNVSPSTLQTLTGPLRLALIDYPRILEVPVPWPLSRRPAENETYSSEQFNEPSIDESSGIEISDPGELLALRAARETYDQRDAGRGHRPGVDGSRDTAERLVPHAAARRVAGARAGGAGAAAVLIACRALPGAAGVPLRRQCRMEQHLCRYSPGGDGWIYRGSARRYRRRDNAPQPQEDVA